jgi:hypothetical protein
MHINIPLVINGNDRNKQLTLQANANTHLPEKYVKGTVNGDLGGTFKKIKEKPGVTHIQA